MNCLIITDENWKNIAILSKRLNYLSPTLNFLKTEVRINLLYTKMTKEIVKILENYELNIIRHCLPNNNSANKLIDILKYTDFCMIFTDFKSKNTKFVIDTCTLNKIPNFIFTESVDYYYNGEICKNKFKKMLNLLTPVKKPIEIVNLPKFQLEEKSLIPKINKIQIIENLRHCYNLLKTKKQNRSIKIIDP